MLLTMICEMNDQPTERLGVGLDFGKALIIAMQVWNVQSHKGCGCQTSHSFLVGSNITNGNPPFCGTENCKVGVRNVRWFVRMSYLKNQNIQRRPSILHPRPSSVSHHATFSTTTKKHLAIVREASSIQYHRITTATIFRRRRSSSSTVVQQQS